MLALFNRVKLNTLLITCLISCLSFRVQAQSTTGVCSAVSDNVGTNVGFNATIYTYTFGSVSGNNYQTFLSTKSQYSSGLVLASKTGLTNVNFNVVPSIFSLNYGQIYGTNILLTSFVVEASAFFIPPTTGAVSYTHLDVYKRQQ